VGSGIGEEDELGDEGEVEAGDEDEKSSGPFI
jgi:hypothetical protein